MSNRTTRIALGLVFAPLIAACGGETDDTLQNDGEPNLFVVAIVDDLPL